MFTREKVVQPCQMTEVSPEQSVSHLTKKHKKSIRNTSLPTIHQLLNSLDLEQYSEAFEENNIDVNMLLIMSDDDVKEALIELHVKKIGDRFKILEENKKI